MLTPAEAERQILEHLEPFPREDCPLSSATGRVLRADLAADRDLPPFDRVTMDGYALRAAAVAGGQRTFRVQAVQAVLRAGSAARAVFDRAGQAIMAKIMENKVAAEALKVTDSPRFAAANAQIPKMGKA